MATRRRLSSRTKVVLALSCGLCILLALAAFGFYSAGEFFSSSAEERQQSQIKADLDLVRRSIERAEAAQMHYRISGDAAARVEFEQMRARVLGKIGELHGMIPDSEQRRTLTQLATIVEAQFAQMLQAMARADAGGAAAQQPETHPSVPNAAKSLIDAISDRERQKARENEEGMEALISRFARLALWSGTIAVGLLLWALMLIKRYEREREQAERALEHARERLASALEGSKSAVWDWDLPRNEIFLSAGWAQMLGREPSETSVRPTDLLELVHPEDLSRVQAAIKSAVSAQTEAYREEHRVRNARGEWIWILSQGRVMRRDAEGRPVRISGINQDITDRKRVEFELQEHDLHLQLALATAGMVRWYWDVESNSFAWPEDPWRLTGPAPRGGYAGLDDLVLHEDLVAFLRKLEQAARSGDRYRDEFRISRTDGRVIWVLATGYVVYADNGTPQRIVGVAQDVSEIKNAEQALRASERELRLITDSVPAFISYVDAQETLRFCNKALAEFVGARPAEVVGRPLRELYGASVYEKLRPYVKRALAGERVQFQRSQPGRRGVSVDLDTTYIPRHGATGEIEGFYALLTDISELKRLDRMKSEFVSTVSHELRTPLTSIRGSLGILAGGVAGPLSDKARGFIDIAKDNCERLIRMINDILDMEKIESGRMSFQMQPFALAPLIQQALEANAGYAHQHGVQLRADAGAPEAWVCVDRDRLQQVLTNLISNACKFSPQGSSVDVAVDRQGERVRVRVTDHGPGISAAFRERIFQKFSQEDSSDMRRKGGTGLGLSISQAIIAGMGGEIGFDSTPGQGSTFYFYLPLSVAPASAQGTGANA